MMIKVYCIKDYDYFKQGVIYYSEMAKNWSGGTYSIGFNIYDMFNNKIGDIGYLYPEVFEPLDIRRKKVIEKLLNEEM